MKIIQWSHLVEKYTRIAFSIKRLSAWIKNRIQHMVDYEWQKIYAPIFLKFRFNKIVPYLDCRSAFYAHLFSTYQANSSPFTFDREWSIYRKLKLLSFLGLFCCFVTVKKSMEWKKGIYLKFIFIILFLALYIQLHDLYFALKTNCLHYRNIGQNFSFLYMPQIHVATMYYFIMF